MSLGAAYFFFQKDANLYLKTNFSREKLTFEGAAMHLELRSPMFGETCISKSMFFLVKSCFRFTSFFVRGVVKNGMCED